MTYYVSVTVDGRQAEASVTDEDLAAAPNPTSHLPTVIEAAAAGTLGMTFQERVAVTMIRSSGRWVQLSSSGPEGLLWLSDAELELGNRAGASPHQLARHKQTFGARRLAERLAYGRWVEDS